MLSNYHQKRIYGLSLRNRPGTCPTLPQSLLTEKTKAKILQEEYNWLLNGVVLEANSFF
jgi:hypothetical protein